MIKKTLLAFFLICSVTPLLANPAGEKLVKERAQLNSAKADLESARQKRDMAVAARWKDRETANKERDLFNERYRESKGQIDEIALSRSRLIEELRVAREDLAQVKQEAEKARLDYVSLSLNPDLLDGIIQLQEEGVPFKIAERIEKINKVKKEMDLYKDNPVRLVDSLFSLLKYELAFSREIDHGQAEFVIENQVKHSFYLRLGALYAMQKSTGDSSVALLLPALGTKKRSFAWQSKLNPSTSASIEIAFDSIETASLLLIPVDPLLSTALSSELESQATKSYKGTIQQFFKDGGILMYPIVILFIMALVIVLERFIVISIKSYSRGAQTLLQNLSPENLMESKEASKKIKGSVGAVIQKSLMHPFSNRSAAEKSIEELFSKEIPNIERGLTTISVIASTAPLLGLLGTVMGMIQLFEVITMHGTSDPKLLAGGISIALITTQAGLMVAIPLQLLHTFLSNLADRLISKMEKTGLSVLNALWVDGDAQ